MSSRDDIVRGIQKDLSGERFLFVLDDVWNKDSRLWDSFFTSLVGLNTANGSCCLLTTRLQITASLVSTSSFKPFVLGKLSDDDCWSILGRRAMKGGEMLKELSDHREQLLKRCQGLPLAANAIGGLLSSQCREDWGSIVEKIFKIREDVEGGIEPVLKLSYDYLPSRYIKKCFVYCSIYAKDAELNGRTVIELWMAEGFLQEGVKGGRTMEEVGVDYLTILLQSSLLEKDHARGGHYRFQMHDLVHDLTCTISKQEQDDGGRCRNLAVGGKKIKDDWNENSTLIRVVEGDVSAEMLLKYRHARVMNLHLSNNIKKLSRDVCKLIHVRSLTISGDRIESLPESLCQLYHLQTLNLYGCHSLQCLPQGLINLISLRHLHFFSGEDFKMTPNMGRLTSLQILEFFNVGEENGCRIEELGFMENLTGSLSIRNLELVKSKEEATSAKLDAKENMIELILEWGSTTTRRNGDNWEDEQVLEGLEPCLGLQKLRITNFMGIRFPGWLGKLTALVSLQLKDCQNITQLGYSGDSGFPNLKTLSIDGCSQLSSVRTPFPILEDLHVENIRVSAVRDIISTATNSLRDLSLDGVSRLRCLSDVIESSLPSCFKNLRIMDCDDLIEIPSSTLECCTCLMWLSVSGCPELVSFPLNLQQTPSLSVILFSDCPKMFMTRDAILPRGFEHLTNLKRLRIGPDNSVQSIDWDGLKRGCSTTLRDLTMYKSCRTQLPHQLQHFSSLVDLWISEFNSLDHLPAWLGKLTSLQLLGLHDCPKLEHLPTDAIRSLNNLRVLYIWGCPLLRETQRDEIKALPDLEVNWRDC